jgi:Transcriptional regulator
MKEFAQKGFKNSSTDVIVKEAAISKGALFHYFQNKKGLYLYLYNYAIDIVKNDILSKLDINKANIFDRTRQSLELKIEVLKKHPEIYDYLAAAYLEEAEDVKSELQSLNKEIIADGKAKLYGGIDTSNFKEDIDVKKAIEIIYWTLEGYTNKEMQKIKNLSMQEVDFEEMLEEVDSYLRILEASFCK